MILTSIRNHPLSMTAANSAAPCLWDGCLPIRRKEHLDRCGEGGWAFCLRVTTYFLLRSICLGLRDSVFSRNTFGWSPQDRVFFSRQGRAVFRGVKGLPTHASGSGGYKIKFGTFLVWNKSKTNNAGPVQNRAEKLSCTERRHYYSASRARDRIYSRVPFTLRDDLKHSGNAV